MKKISVCRVLTGAAAALMLLWFAAPLAAGILNIANATGMLFFAAVLAGAVFWPRLRQFFRKLREKKAARILLAAVCLLLCAVLILTLATAGRIAVQAMKTPDGSCPAVIVLGCQVHGTAPSRLLRYRLEAARDYLQSNPDAVCVVSGGMGSGEAVTEAECMFRELVKYGIAPERILKEERATNTWENILYSKQLLEENGTEGVSVLVSNGFHLCRAAEMAGRAELPVQTLAAKTSFYTLPTYVFREVIAIWKLHILGP